MSLLSQQRSVNGPAYTKECVYSIASGSAVLDNLPFESFDDGGGLR